MSIEAPSLPIQEFDLLSGPPVVTNAHDYVRIRETLRNAGYNEENINKAVGGDNLTRLKDRKTAVHLRRTEGGTHLETLIRLFLLDHPEEISVARSALAPMSLEQWADCGLIQIGATHVRANVHLRCFQDMVFAFDFLRRGPGGLRPDYVMGVSPSSLMLANMTIRKPYRTALDVGCGCGIQAILAARHCEHVLGIDLSERAVIMSRFNAGLNGISNVEFLEGNMFAPADGKTFDFIVSNPPFIISPSNQHMFLNSGLDADEICRQVAQQSARYLNEGAYCIFNANWAVTDSEDWRKRLQRWFVGTGCDVLAIFENVRSVDEYGATLIEMSTAEEPAHFAGRFDEWMRYYDERGIKGIGSGLIVMRRTSGRDNWFSVEAVPPNVSFPAGEDVERIFQSRTFLNSFRTAEEFLEARLRLAPNVRFNQISEVVDGAWKETSARVLRVGGLEFTGAIDAASAAVLARCQGERPLREVLTEMAAAQSVEYSKWLPSALQIVRRLVEQGFLVPADDK
jgi:methylase of polypeptide subunit release factors